MAELCKRATHFSGGYLNDVMAAMRSGMENSGRLNVLQSPKPLATALSQSWFKLVFLVVVSDNPHTIAYDLNHGLV